MLDELRDLKIDRIDLDEAVGLLAYGNAVTATYQVNELEAPEWLKENVAALTKHVKARRRDNLERALKAAVAKEQQLKTIDEKRADTKAEIERLRAALGQ